MSLNFLGLGFGFGAKDTGLSKMQKEVHQGFKDINDEVERFATNAKRVKSAGRGFADALPQKACAQYTTCLEGMATTMSRTVVDASGKASKAVEKDSKASKQALDLMEKGFGAVGDAVTNLKAILKQSKLQTLIQSLGLGNLQGALQRLPGAFQPRDLFDPIEQEFAQLNKSSRALGANLGYTGKELDQVSSKASGMAYSMKMDVQTTMTAIKVWKDSRKELELLGFASEKQVAKFQEVFQVSGDVFAYEATRMKTELGFTDDQIKTLTGSTFVMGQKIRDVGKAMNQMKDLNTLLAQARGAGMSAEEAHKLGVETQALAAGIYTVTQSADEANQMSMQFARTMVESRDSFQGMIAGVGGLPKFLEEAGIASGNFGTAFDALQQGPLEFMQALDKMIEAEGGWANVSADRMNFFRQHFAEALGDKRMADVYIGMMKNGTEETDKFIAEVLKANVDLGKAADESFRTGMTLEERWQRVMAQFKHGVISIGRPAARDFVRDASKQFSEFNKTLKGIVEKGGPLGMLITKMSEVQQLGTLALVPKDLRPMAAVLGQATEAALPTVAAMGSLGLQFKHLVNPVTLAGGAIIGIGLTMRAFEKDLIGNVEAMAQSDKAMRREKNTLNSLEKQLGKAREGTEEYAKLKDAIEKKKQGIKTAESIRAEEKALAGYRKQLKKAEEGSAKYIEAQQNIKKSEEELVNLRKGLQQRARDESKEHIKDMAGKATETVVGFIQALPSIVRGVVDFLKTDMMPIATEIYSGFKEIFDEAFKMLQTVDPGQVEQITYTVTDTLTEALKTVAGLDWHSIFTSMTETGGSFLNAVFFGAEGEDSAAAKLGGTINTIAVTAIDIAWEGVKAAAAGWWTRFTESWREIDWYGGVGAFWSSIGDAMVDSAAVLGATVITAMFFSKAIRGLVMTGFKKLLGGLFMDLPVGGAKKLWGWIRGTKADQQQVTTGVATAVDAGAKQAKAGVEQKVKSALVAAAKAAGNALEKYFKIAAARLKRDIIQACSSCSLPDCGGGGLMDGGAPGAASPGGRRKRRGAGGRRRGKRGASRGRSLRRGLAREPSVRVAGRGMRPDASTRATAKARRQRRRTSDISEADLTPRRKNIRRREGARGGRGLDRALAREPATGAAGRTLSPEPSTRAAARGRRGRRGGAPAPGGRMGRRGKLMAAGGGALSAGMMALSTAGMLGIGPMGGMGAGMDPTSQIAMDVGIEGAEYGIGKGSEVLAKRAATSGRAMETAAAGADDLARAGARAAGSMETAATASGRAAKGISRFGGAAMKGLGTVGRVASKAALPVAAVMETGMALYTVSSRFEEIEPGLDTTTKKLGALGSTMIDLGKLSATGGISAFFGSPKDLQRMEIMSEELGASAVSFATLGISDLLGFREALPDMQEGVYSAIEMTDNFFTGAETRAQKAAEAAQHMSNISQDALAKSMAASSQVLAKNDPVMQSKLLQQAMTAMESMADIQDTLAKLERAEKWGSITDEQKEQLGQLRQQKLDYLALVAQSTNLGEAQLSSLYHLKDSEDILNVSKGLMIEYAAQAERASGNLGAMAAVSDQLYKSMSGTVWASADLDKAAAQAKTVLDANLKLQEDIEASKQRQTQRELDSIGAQAKSFEDMVTRYESLEKVIYDPTSTEEQVAKAREQLTKVRMDLMTVGEGLTWDVQVKTEQGLIAPEALEATRKQVQDVFTQFGLDPEGQGVTVGALVSIGDPLAIKQDIDEQIKRVQEMGFGAVTAGVALDESAIQAAMALVDEAGKKKLEELNTAVAAARAQHEADMQNVLSTMAKEAVNTGLAVSQDAFTATMQQMGGDVTGVVAQLNTALEGLGGFQSVEGGFNMTADRIRKDLQRGFSEEEIEAKVGFKQITPQEFIAMLPDVQGDEAAQQALRERLQLGMLLSPEQFNEQIAAFGTAFETLSTDFDLGDTIREDMGVAAESFTAFQEKALESIGVVKKAVEDTHGNSLNKVIIEDFNLAQVGIEGFAQKSKTALERFAVDVKKIFDELWLDVLVGTSEAVGAIETDASNIAGTLYAMADAMDRVNLAEEQVAGRAVANAGPAGTVVVPAAAMAGTQNDQIIYGLHNPAWFTQTYRPMFGQLLAKMDKLLAAVNKPESQGGSSTATGNLARQRMQGQAPKGLGGGTQTNGNQQSG